MKIELSIKTDYLPKWGVFEGIRELIQNGRDAEIEFNAPLTVRHHDNTLVIETTGKTLPHEALLFGFTTKTDKGELIGKFGEGLKLGVLALVRAGYETKIRSGSEIWTPRIERSERFDADVLVFHIEKGRKEKDRIQVVVFNVSKEEWDKMKSCFLFFEKKDENRIETIYGALLLGEKHVGNLYVKGIFVEHDPELKFGYDLTKDVEIDRDRKMIARYDLNWRVRTIWQYAVKERNDLVDSYLNMLKDESRDLNGLDSYGASLLPNAVKELAAATFRGQYGEDAVPVDSLLASKDVEHLGKKGILVTNKSLKVVLEEVFGTTDQIKGSLAKEVTKSYSWGDLTSVEQANLESAISLVNTVEAVTLNEVEVVDFRSEGIEGMFRGGQILVAKNKLSERDRTLEIVIHEVAHRTGADGSLGHVANIERIWSRIVSNFRDRDLIPKASDTN